MIVWPKFFLTKSVFYVQFYSFVNFENIKICRTFAKSKLKSRSIFYCFLISLITKEN